METGTARWLRLGYSEGAAIAGFGTYPAADASTPTLYATHGATTILAALGRTIQGAEEVGHWVSALCDERGLYDDPATQAPVYVETAWALDILRAVGAQDEAARSISAILGMLSAWGLDPDAPLLEEVRALGDLLGVLRCLEAAGLKSTSIPPVERDRLTNRLVSAQAACDAAGHPEPWRITTPEARKAWLTVTLLARLAPDRLSEPSRAFLEAHLSSIAQAPLGYTGCSLLMSLLAALGYTTSELPGTAHQSLVTYLTDSVRTAVPPEIPGFGFKNSLAGVLDPEMSSNLLRLFAIAELDYPLAEAVLDWLEVTRVPSGWLLPISVEPSVEETWRALIVSRDLPTSFVSQPKVLAWAASELHSSTPESLRRVYTAALVCVELGRQMEDVQSSVLSALAEAGEAILSRDTRWLARIVIDLQLCPDELPTPALEQLQAEGTSCGEIIRSAPPMAALAQHAALAHILGVSACSSSALTAQILALARPDGGFGAAPAATFSDMESTLAAVEALAWLGYSELTPVARCQQFVAACKAGIGYSLLTPEAAESVGAEPQVDLFTTSDALELLQILDQL